MMNKERAKDIIMAYACCSFTTDCNNLCPWNETSDCTNTTIDEEEIVEAMNILRNKEM